MSMNSGYFSNSGILFHAMYSKLHVQEANSTVREELELASDDIFILYCESSVYSW